MTRRERLVTIDRPADEVFGFLADGTNNPRWQPPVIETTPAGGQPGVGARFHQTLRHPLGFKVSGDYRVVVYEPGRELALQTTSGGPVRPMQRYQLTADGAGGTTVRSVIEYQPKGFVRLALPKLALLRPLFAWEASWVENLADALGSAGGDRPMSAPEDIAPAGSR